LRDRGARIFESERAVGGLWGFTHRSPLCPPIMSWMWRNETFFTESNACAQKSC
jgi:hypothetical protein